MPSGTFIDSIRAAADNGVGIVATTSLSPYTVTLVTVTNDQVNYNDSTATRNRVDTLLTVGAGIGANLNPHVQYLTKYDSNQVTVLAGAALTDTDLLLGPLVFPYNTGFQAGGIDPTSFAPGPTAASNTQVYLKVQGEGFNQANGNYFKVKEVVLNGMDNVMYYVRLSSISDVIP